jgi:hypothetical protein
MGLDTDVSLNITEKLVSRDLEVETMELWDGYKIVSSR